MKKNKITVLTGHARLEKGAAAPAVLVGASYGGYAALALACRQPDLAHLRAELAQRLGRRIERRDALADALQVGLCAPLGVYFVLGNHDAFVEVADSLNKLSEKLAQKR